MIGNWSLRIREKRGQQLCVHGRAYSLKDGLLLNIGLSITGPERLPG